MDKELHLWHSRMGHVHVKALKRLAQNEDVFGLEKCNFEKGFSCDSCDKSKSTRASFGKDQSTTATEPLEHLHMNLGGPN
uniref:GAG-pre-integrase domain-containing protein n=1 Tax=Strigamia maritima TaxID=126957 RepID=T1IRC1_STRMM